MKVLFLDISGVLYTKEYITKIINLLGRSQYVALLRNIMIPFDYRSCKLLRDFVTKTNTKVILSSTWRLNPKSFNIIREYAGIEIYDKTPTLIEITRKEKQQYIYNYRGEEIQQYLDNHKEITNYVILDDDDSNILESQMKHFVKVDGKVGLTIKEIIQCEEILNMEE